MYVSRTPWMSVYQQNVCQYESDADASTVHRRLTLTHRGRVSDVRRPLFHDPYALFYLGAVLIYALLESGVQV